MHHCITLSRWVGLSPTSSRNSASSSPAMIIGESSGFNPACRVTGGEPPEIDLAYEKRVQDCVLEAHRRALLAAAHDISDGGLLVALAECCFAAEPARGVAVTLGGKQPLEAVLFGEEPSRLLLEVDEKQLAELLRLAREYQVEARQLGWTSAGEFRVHFNRQVVLEEDIATLREVWQAGLPQALQTVGSL